MKHAVLAVALLLSITAFSQPNYPIKTIFKGDSVVILTVQQSEKINQMLEKNAAVSKENRKKNQEYEQEIEKLNQIISAQTACIDSLSNVLLDCWVDGEGTSDSLWKWALGPSLIYTQYPDDSAVYVMDLSHYYMTADDFGIIMVRMSDREYEKYREFINRYGLSEDAFWRFRNEMRIKRIRGTEIKQKRVWKFKLQWNKEEHK